MASRINAALTQYREDNSGDYFHFRPVKASKKRSKKKNLQTRSYVVKKAGDEHLAYYIGEICIGTTNNNLPLQYEKSTVQFLDDGDNLLFAFDTVSVVVCVTMEIGFVKDLFLSNALCFKFSVDNDHLSACVYFMEMPIINPYRAAKVLKPIFNLIFNVSVEAADKKKLKILSRPEEILHLYKTIKDAHDRDEKLNSLTVKHPALNPTLRPYQEKAVRWMCSREQDVESEEFLHPSFEKIVLPTGITIYYDKYNGIVEMEKPSIKMLGTGGILADEMGLGKTVEILCCILMHPKEPSCAIDSSISPFIHKQTRKRKKAPSYDSNLYVLNKKQILLVKDNQQYKNKSLGYIALDTWYNSVLTHGKSKSTVEIKVGCICGNTDMKNTVECVDCRRRQHSSCMGFEVQFGQYSCPQCWTKKPLLHCKGTLIVCPVSLKAQWCEEITKHIAGNLKIFVYEGISYAPVYPMALQDYDIVITTYNVLQVELRLTDNEEVVNLRRPPKYCQPGSPIALMKWWRLCLDEAQTIENLVMVSQMAQKINAVYRWAVTGTPISKTITDLFSLINYLQFEPYSETSCWDNLLLLPYLQGNKEPMYNFLSQVMWRTSKNDVLEQINIPKQTILEHWLEFTPVERYFYAREYEMSSIEFTQKLKNHDVEMPLKLLDKRLLRELLVPLLSLRKACAHFNAVKGRYLTTKKPVSSMGDLLDALVAKNVNESCDSLRCVISSLNGQAGIYFLLQNPKAAIEHYQKVIAFAEKFSMEESPAKLTVDSLQMIHTLYNLAEILEAFPQPEIETENCKQKQVDLEKKYMNKHTTLTISMVEEAVHAAAGVDETLDKFTSDPKQWFSEFLDWISATNNFKDYVNRITHLHENDAHDCNLEKFISSPAQVCYLVATWHDVIFEQRAKTLHIFESLYERNSDDEFSIPAKVVETATDCHLRPNKKTGKKKKKCGVCLAQHNLRMYEAKLFAMTKQERDISNSGSWKPALEEYVLKALHSVAKQKHPDERLTGDGETYLNLLDILKREFKELSKLWMQLNVQISASDELDMCKIRMTLKDPTEGTQRKKTKLDNILKQLDVQNEQKDLHEVDEAELHYHLAVLEGQEKLHMHHLETNMGKYSYLETLKLQQFNGHKPDPCPICRCVLEKQWNILQCGHSYCLDCVQVLLGHVKGQYITCSICRQEQKINDISYIQTEQMKSKEEDTRIKGNMSTKMEAVVRLIMNLKKDNETVKVLVFSHWLTLLQIMRNVLQCNQIACQLFTNQDAEKILRNFKDECKGVTVLLLPVSCGGKGLNLIEATQVIFLEPLLYPGEELQAIGRVHRIGQTKPTVVHKFLMRRTIEENIHSSITSDAEKWDQNKVTLRQICNLFENTKVSAT